MVRSGLRPRPAASTWQPAPASVHQPPFDVLGDEPAWTILADEAELRDRDGASRLGDPREADVEQASDVVGPEQRRERQSVVLVSGGCTIVVTLSEGYRQSAVRSPTRRD